ncbi:MAG: hypothetical protein ACLU62_08620 [Hydrogeniiclostridium sp.]
MKQKRWHKLLKVSSLAIASFLLVSCFGCAKEETEKQHVRIEASFAQLSLGDIVRMSEYIAYGEVIEKGPVTTPEYASDYDYGKNVTVRVKKGLLNCEEGDTIVYWELGGEAPNGKIYEYPGINTAEVGDNVLVFVDNMKSELSGPFIEDTDGNVNVLKDLMVEEEHETPEDPYGFDVLPMAEYMEKVEGVIQAQAEDK